MNRISRTIGRILKFFFNFYFRNMSKILEGHVVYGRGNKFNQVTKITGNGKVEIGDGCTFGYRQGGHFRNGAIEIQARTGKSRIIIREKVSFNNNTFLCAANIIEIGARTLIGEHVSFFDHEAHNISPSDRNKPGRIGEIKIGENVWIGNNVSVLTDTEIGDNSVVALGAVVKGKFPGNVIIGGIPAKVIKEIQ